MIPKRVLKHLRARVAFHDKNDRQLLIPSGLRNGYTHRRLIPDLVFDVKYKTFDFRYGVDRGDLFQIHTYVGQISSEHDVAGCGFIYPVREKQWRNSGLEAEEGIVSNTIIQGGRTISFHVVFLKIPEQGGVPSDEWPLHFRKAFAGSADNFVRTFLERITAAVRSESHRAFA